MSLFIKEKGRPRPGVALFCSRLNFLIATVSCCTAASACRIAGTEFDVGIDFKPVSQKIDLYGLRFLIKFFVNDKLETIYIEHIIVVFGLIQSHGKGRAASTACIQKDADRRDLFAIKVFLNLFGRFFSYTIIF
jgi:hypothetical protein